MIKITSLTFKDILHEIETEIPKGIIFLKGNNGAGKSTLLDCICGLNRDYMGQITGNESILYLNQNLYFDYRLKCKDFVKFVMDLENIKIPKEDFFYSFPLSQERIDRMWNTPIGMLSGGERAKVFFNIISFIDREWYVLDEPFSGIDEDGVSFMKEVILKLNGQNKGIIITSHEKSGIEGLPIKKTYLISDGKLTCQ